MPPSDRTRYHFEVLSTFYPIAMRHQAKQYWEAGAKGEWTEDRRRAEIDRLEFNPLKGTKLTAEDESELEPSRQRVREALDHALVCANGNEDDRTRFEEAFDALIHESCLQEEQYHRRRSRSNETQTNESGNTPHFKSEEEGPGVGPASLKPDEMTARSERSRDVNSEAAIGPNPQDMYGHRDEIWKRSRVPGWALSTRDSAKDRLKAEFISMVKFPLTKEEEAFLDPALEQMKHDMETLYEIADRHEDQDGFNSAYDTYLASGRALRTQFSKIRGPASTRADIETGRENPSGKVGRDDFETVKSAQGREE